MMFQITWDAVATRGHRSEVRRWMGLFWQDPACHSNLCAAATRMSAAPPGVQWLQYRLCRKPWGPAGQVLQSARAGLGSELSDRMERSELLLQIYVTVLITHTLVGSLKYFISLFRKLTDLLHILEWKILFLEVQHYCYSHSIIRAMNTDSTRRTLQTKF